ncbi:DUF952 domain-containing protein [Brevundimonas faecalis]|uniref:Uncharacterized protein (DUF952 family) n=1 Tax=Brevundimonas faecalis TaxID=947378 RepID=A0ABV2RFH5_9CAUL
MTVLPTTAYKILGRADWRATLAEGAYDGSAVDLADGYIHLSAADQLEGTAAKHYAGQSDLMLIEVDLTALGEALVWEPSRGGALFPHIYGPLPVAATRGARSLSVTPDGRMILDEA